MTKPMKMIEIKKCFWCGADKFKTAAFRNDDVEVRECKKCHLLQVASMPEDLTAYYDNKEYFNPDENNNTGYHENYDLLSPFYLYWQGALIEEIARIGKKNSLLEVGCATGNALEMIKIFNPDLSIQGVDISTYAIKICKEKGLKATVSTINNFKSPNKFDIIFSSETMEHVSDLKDFIKSIKNNLAKDGVFVFFVPAVQKDELIREGKKYPPLRSSLEHISYFTEEFLHESLPTIFDAKIYSKLISTAGEDYHIGIITKDSELLKYLKRFIEGFKIYDDTFSDSKSLYNLEVISSKFAYFDSAEKYLQRFEKNNVSNKDIYFLKGILGYSKGELIQAKKYFQKYLGEDFVSNFTLKVFLSVERELVRLLESENNNFRNNKSQLDKRIFDAESELEDFKKSKIIGIAVSARLTAKKISNLIQGFKKKIRIKSRIKLIFKKVSILIPPKIKHKIRYVIELKVLTKKIIISNSRYPDSKPLVSVVIPYYNAGATIEETLVSLENQTFRRFEVILVNDGSSLQQSVDKLLVLKLNGIKLKIINQRNQGVAAARNKGIINAKGKYIVCLDSDDILDQTYLEKCLLILETNPNVNLVSSDMKLFGVRNLVYRQGEYQPLELLNNNMVLTAAMFNKDCWDKVGGYKSNLGYEDWEFWINLAENGYFGKRIPEPLFNYRTAISSRYIDDQKNHKNNITRIKTLHQGFTNKVKKILRRDKFDIKLISSDSLFVNLDKQSSFKQLENKLPNVLIAMSWMTFGGAETLVYNFCSEINELYNLHFITGVKSENEWEYKFREISPFIYHLANLFNDDLYLEFISNYIKIHNIDILHIVHTDFIFKSLPEIKRRHPNLIVIVTMFNDRVPHYFMPSIELKDNIDIYTSDNLSTSNHYKKELNENKLVKTIPNGIDCFDVFNPEIFNRKLEREQLEIQKNDIAVFFVGRLSIEKNPIVYLDVAKRIINSNISNVKFFMIGDGPMRPSVEKQIKNIKSDRLKYLGYQTNIARYLSAADIFVLPSSIEGFPMSILEAMAMKVAVIASDVGAVSDVITNENDGFIVKPGSVNEIVENIIKLNNDKELLNSIKANARLKVEEKYSNSVLKNNYLELYRDILK